MRKLTHDDLVAQRLPATQALQAKRYPITLMLEDIRSLYNVGSIFRSADAFRIERILLTGYTPRPPRKEISKTALGADETVPWTYVESSADAVEQLKAEGVRVFAVELAESSLPLSAITSLLLASPSSHVALILGNELTGVSSSVMGLCEGAVEIPMFGTKHSLNVAVAAGIVLHAVVAPLPHLS